jgi:hypothetical protein
MPQAVTQIASADTMDFSQCVTTLQKFCGTDLTRTLATIEALLQGLTAKTCPSAIAPSGANSNVLAAAGLVKNLAGQVNVVIHALGILLCLPRLLEPGETVQYASIGAGNTGRAFDLETTHRIAEFKFIRWRGGAEAIRQNSLFKDFYLMAEHDTVKRKYLYVLGTEQPLKFLNGGRAVSSVLSHHVRLRNQFLSKYGEQYRRVRDYYLPRKNMIVIQDVMALVPELASIGIDSDDSAL